MSEKAALNSVGLQRQPRVVPVKEVAATYFVDLLERQGSKDQQS